MSVSANYRAARRARSKKEFIAKLGIVVEEVDETAHWLELLRDGKTIERGRLEPIMREAEELTKIFVSMRQTAKKNN